MAFDRTAATIINTPNLENTLVGTGFGLMLSGLQAAFFMKQQDFLLLGVDHLVNTYNSDPAPRHRRRVVHHRTDRGRQRFRRTRNPRSTTCPTFVRSRGPRVTRSPTRTTPTPLWVMSFLPRDSASSASANACSNAISRLGIRAVVPAGSSAVQPLRARRRPNDRGAELRLRTGGRAFTAPPKGMASAPRSSRPTAWARSTGRP